MEKYTDLSTKLGRGSCGHVKLMQRKSDMKLFAMKVIELATEEAAKNAENESNFLERLQHPNIVKFYETFVQKEGLYLVMEYCEQGDLQKNIKEVKANKEYLPEEQILTWFTQVCLAVKQLHDNHILHRDIKVHNIFLTSEGLVKLGDFGISKQLDHSADLAQTWLGTPFYASPELLSYSVSSYKSDVWMLGCLLHELCSLEKPFFADNLSAVINKILHENYSKVPEHYTSFVHRLIAMLLDKNADKRPTIDAILQMPEIQQEMDKLRLKYPEVYGLILPASLSKASTLLQAGQASPQLIAKRWTSESIASHQVEAVFAKRSENSKGENMNTTWDLGKDESAKKVTPSSQESLKNSMPDMKRKSNNIRALVEQKKAILSPLNTGKLDPVNTSNSANQVSHQSFSSMLSTSNQASAGQDGSETPVVNPFRLPVMLSEPNEPVHEDKRQVIRLNTLENIKKQSSVEYGLADKYEEARAKDLPCQIKSMEGSSKKHHNLSINIPSSSEHGGDSPAQVKTQKAQPAKIKSSVSGDVPTTKVGAKKSFAFSNYLLDQKLPISPNRTFWVTQFLKQKLGEEKFEAVKDFIDNSGNATQLLNENPEKVLEIIGEDKKDCLVMLSFLISHNANSVTPTGEGKVRTHRSSQFDNTRPFKGYKSPASANPFLKNIFANSNDPNSADRVNGQLKI